MELLKLILAIAVMAVAAGLLVGVFTKPAIDTINDLADRHNVDPNDILDYMSTHQSVSLQMIEHMLNGDLNMGHDLFQTVKCDRCDYYPCQCEYNHYV